MMERDEKHHTHNCGRMKKGQDCGYPKVYSSWYRVCGDTVCMGGQALFFLLLRVRGVSGTRLGKAVKCLADCIGSTVHPIGVEMLDGGCAVDDSGPNVERRPHFREQQ